MNVPLNQEHKEAEQSAANKEREAFLATLPKKELAKFRTVEKAVQMLVKAGIPFYLFPYLPSSNFKGKYQMWQWNSLPEVMKYDKHGKPTKESMAEVSMINEALFAFLFNQFHNFFNGETLEQKLDSVPFFFYHCLKKHKDYLDEETTE